MSETKESILARATELFLRRSYEGVSIQDIAREVGLTKSSLYPHFPKGKEQIFHAVAGSIFERIVFDYAPHPPMPLGELCRTFLAIQHKALARTSPAPLLKEERKRGTINFYGLQWDAFRNLPDYRLRIEEHTHREAEAWRMAAERSMKCGEIRGDLDPKRVAQLFTAVLDGVGIAIVWKGRRTYFEDIEELWGSLLKVLAPVEGA